MQHADLVKPEMLGGQIFAPPTIPHRNQNDRRGPEALPSINVATMDDGNGSDGNNPFDSGNQRPVVREQVTGPVRVSGLVVEAC